MSAWSQRLWQMLGKGAVLVVIFQTARLGGGCLVVQNYYLCEAEAKNLMHALSLDGHAFSLINRMLY